MGPELDLAALLDLVGLIYDVALSPGGWDPLLDRLTQMLGGTAAIFFVQDRQNSVEFARLWGLPQRALDEYEGHFAALDVGLERLMWRRPSVAPDATACESQRLRARAGPRQKRCVQRPETAARPCSTSDRR